MNAASTTAPTANGATAKIIPVGTLPSFVFKNVISALALRASSFTDLSVLTMLVLSFFLPSY